MSRCCVRIQRDGGAQRRHRLGQLALLGQPARLASLGFARIRQQPVDELAQLRFGQGPDERIDRFAVDEGDHVGDAANPELRRQFRALI